MRLTVKKKAVKTTGIRASVKKSNHEEGENLSACSDQKTCYSYRKDYLQVI